ncbi:hypothetical protein [Streptomyces fumanus]|nr:hypothetical protein [Streptomyces fumanus]
MASESELAAQGIAGSADVLPVPVGPGPQAPGPASLAGLRQAALTDLPPGTRWRVIATDSESLTGVAPVCTAERSAALHAIPDHPGGPTADDEGVYDCCPWPQIETYSVPVAAYLVAVLNADAALAQAASPGVCPKCGYGSGDWCVGCSACRCQPHLAGCMYAAGGAS